jgi:repressor LexA
MTDAWSTELRSAAGAFDLCATAEIPLLGEVAAGLPYQAFPLEDTLTVPAALWGGKRVFALRVRGSSMVDEGIHNGDYLIVEPRADAENGQTVVVEVDGAVTVKKYYRQSDGEVRLQPANPEMLPLIVRGERVRVIGVVTGVLRKFGFNRTRRRDARRSTPSSTPASQRRSHAASGPADAASIDLEVNVIDAQLERWNAALARAQSDRRLRRHVGAMAELARDLQTLRDWCARTRKPGLRRALLAEANGVIRRMQRVATVTPLELPELVVH